MSKRSKAKQELPVSSAPAWRIEHSLLLAVLTLVATGVVMVFSASMDSASLLRDAPAYYLQRHLIYALMALSAAVIVYQVPLTVWQRSGGVLLILSLLLLALVLVPGIGRTVNGSTRWISLGVINVQVSEIAKVFVMMYLAGYLVRREEQLRDGWGAFSKLIFVLMLMVVLLLLEPDFGAVVVIMSAALGVMFISGVRLSQFAVLIVSFVGFAALLVVTAPYRVRRFAAFVDPWQDMYNTGYQLTQSLIAFGRGEWFGVGLGQSVQKLFYLPEAHTDFVFAVLSEELGLMGGALMIVTFLSVALMAFVIGKRALTAKDRFAGYLAYGLGLLIALQAFINMGVNNGLLPTKGLTLPFVSYGGSSLIMSSITVAILIRIARTHPRLVDESTRGASAEAKPARSKQSRGKSYGGQKTRQAFT